MQYHLNPLKKVYLELTDSCNLECEICYRHQWVEEPRDMSEALWKDVVAQIREIPSVETIVLGGMGEPLVSPFFHQTIETFKDKQIWVTSNGTMFREKLTAPTVAGINLFIVSIDGMQEQMVKGRGVDFKELMAEIDFLNQLKKENDTPHLDIQFVASRKNIDDIFPLMDVLAEKKIRNLVISHLMPQHLEQADDILYKRYDNQELKQLFHRIRNYSFKRGLRIIFPETELKTERRCAFVNNDATYITSRGEIVPCYRLSHQGSEVVFGRPKVIRQYSFGNLKSKPLQAIWSDPGYVRFRSKIYNNHYPSCPDCDLVEGCSLIHDVDFDCHGEEPNCADCLWARKFVFCN
ncbi:MAG: radical SAM protein [Bacteroidetes bacterium]|nr:MAG: radical SAM protein [Bacteroidota bacterium]